MNNTGKLILSMLLLIFLCFHFLFIISYTAPLKTGSTGLNAAGSIYCYPYFHQQWTVFVPAPTKQFDLYIRNGSANKWQPWINITQRLINKHKRNVLLGRETEVLLITNSINYVSYDLGEESRLFNDDPGLPSITVLQHAAKYYFRNYRCWREGKDYELLLVTRSLGKKTTYYFKNLSLL